MRARSTTVSLHGPFIFGVQWIHRAATGRHPIGAHVELLVKHGVHLVEHLKLEELSMDRCYEFLFFVSPLLITGASASPVSPVAIG